MILFISRCFNKHQQAQPHSQLQLSRPVGVLQPEPVEGGVVIGLPCSVVIPQSVVSDRSSEPVVFHHHHQEHHSKHHHQADQNHLGSVAVASEFLRVHDWELGSS